MASSSTSISSFDHCYVIANGGMETYDNVQTILQQTGAAAAMSSEGLLEIPNLFVNPKYPHSMTPLQIFQQQIQFCRDYLDLVQQYPPIPGVLGMYGSWTIVRGHLIKFLHRYLQHDHNYVNHHRGLVLTSDLRDSILFPQDDDDGGVVACSCVADAYPWINELEYRYNQLTEDDWELLPSSRKYEVSWYRRHYQDDGKMKQSNHMNYDDDGMVRHETSPTTTTSSTSRDEQKRQILLRIQALRQERLGRNKGIKQQQQQLATIQNQNDEEECIASVA